MNEEYDMEQCKVCYGTGIVPEHDSRHGEDGECLTCPVPAPCVKCEATGEVPKPRTEYSELTPDFS